MKLYAVVSARTNMIVWSAFTTDEVAEQAAIRTAVSSGNCNLLSGRELADHLVDFAHLYCSPAATAAPTVDVTL